MTIKIFEAEKNLGLEKIIYSNASIKYTTSLLPSKNVYTSKANTDNSDPLLYKITDVLASSGWNLNEDVFDPYELYSARKTPIHKPFDIEHEESNIIGHITGSTCITGDMEDGDSDYAEMSDDLALSKIPAKFHILNDSVIYKTWTDEEKIEATEIMIQEIEDGLWFVSMECKFSGFDYSVINPDGEEIVIPRTEDTAFLTRNLRAYGGDGEYHDKANDLVYKIGRMMKDIIFSGKGLVKKPANPSSVIINAEENVQASKNKVYVNTVDVTSNLDDKEQIMPDDKDLQAKIDLLVSEKASLSKELDTVKASQTSEKISLQASQIEQLNIQLTATKEFVDKHAKANDELSDKLAKVEKELSELKAEKKKVDRTKKVKDAGADDEDVASTLSNLETLTDAQFDAVIETMAKTMKNMKKTVPNEPNDVKDNPSSYSSEAAKKLIDDAKKDETVSLTVTTPSNVESTRATIAEKMLSRIKKK